MKKQVFEPFADRGVAAAQGPAPSLLSAKAGAFLERALAARKGSGASVEGKWGREVRHASLLN
jgi:hypothetical protein